MNNGTINSPVWTEQLRICSYDVDSTRHATIVSLCRYFFEAAWNHAEALGVGFARMAQSGNLWVLSRLLIEVSRYPEWGSRVTLRTWPRGVNSVFAMRDFEMADAEGTILAAGASGWLVLDAASKRPQRIHKLLPELAHLDGKLALGRDPEKLPAVERAPNLASAAVRYTDIDVNNHVNSARYIGWILDSYPTGFHHDQVVRSLEINYVGETLEAEMLTVGTLHERDLSFAHSLFKANDNEVCRARLQWHARSTVRTAGGLDLGSKSNSRSRTIIPSQSETSSA